MLKIRRVVGRSMEPTLFEGDIIVIGSRTRAMAGDIVVAKVNGREVIKRVAKVSHKRYVLHGDNARHSTDSREYGAVSEKSIAGVALWQLHVRRYRGDGQKSNNRFEILTSGAVLLGILALAVIGFGLLLSKLTLAAYDIRTTPHASVSAQSLDAIPLKTQQPINSVTATAMSSTAQAHKIVPSQVIKDIPYCDGQKLDIYYPRNIVWDTAPVVMYIHGGGWRMNNKSSEPDQLARLDGLRNAGYAVVSIDYRLLPDYHYPAPIQDALCAVRFLRANQAQYDLNADRMAVYGFSSGGHLAAMVATLDTDNPFNNGQYKDQSSRVDAVVVLAGELDFQHGNMPGRAWRLKTFLQGADAASAEPITYITPDDPPFLLIHGEKDQYVSIVQEDFFAAKLQANHVPVQRLFVANADHGLNPRGGVMSPSNQEIDKTITDFVTKKLGS